MRVSETGTVTIGYGTVTTTGFGTNLAGVPEYQDEPFYEDDELISDAYSAVWKALTEVGLSNVTTSTVVKVYGITYSVVGISKTQIIVHDQNNVALSIPNYPWSSFAQ